MLTRFTRIYWFLSQVVSFTDVKLERDYLFCRRLAQLVRQESVVGVDLGDSIELTHLRMEQQWERRLVLDAADGEVITIYGGGGRTTSPEEVPLSEVIKRINERFAMGITENDASSSNRSTVPSSPTRTCRSRPAPTTSSDSKSASTWSSALTTADDQRELVYRSSTTPTSSGVARAKRPEHLRRARVARQRTCPISELILPAGETRFLEYKSTMRWDVNTGEQASSIEDSIVQTIAGFANSPYGGTLLVGVTDGGASTASTTTTPPSQARRARRPRPLGPTRQEPARPPGQVGRLARRLGILCHRRQGHLPHVHRPRDHPVYETRRGEQLFWWRTPVSTDASRRTSATD